MNMAEIDHDMTHEAVCPHCGYEHGDSWEFGGQSGRDVGHVDCMDCGKPFSWSREYEVTYTTRKVAESTAPAMGNEHG